MTKIALIDMAGWQGANDKGDPYPNIGIAYLVAALHRHGHEAVVLDMNNQSISDEQLISCLDDTHVDLIGLSVKTATMANARRIGLKIKERFPSIPIIVGGPHVTVAALDIFKEPWVDYVLLGEGEDVLPLLCTRFDNHLSINDLAAVITRRENPAVLGISAARVNNLDELDFPDYNLFGAGVRNVLRSNYPLITSRGCPYKCTYCSVAKISGNRVRTRSPDNVIVELLQARERFGVTGFEIVDDSFNVDIVRAKAICNLLIEQRLEMTWSCPNGIRADRVDSELAVLMKQAGCHFVMVGVESADPAILESVKKGESLTDIERGIHLLQHAGLAVGGFFIIGLPGDSYAAQEVSAEFARRNGIHAHFNMLVPYPGTDVHKWVCENGTFMTSIEEGVHFADSSKKVMPVFETADFTANERWRAYEMVHTRLAKFDMLIPKNAGKLTYDIRKLSLLARYDRRQLVSLIKRWFVENVCEF